MTEYKLKFTKEKDDVVDNNFTTEGEYVLIGEEDLNLDPEPFILEHLTRTLFECFLKAKDKGDLPWN